MTFIHGMQMSRFNFSSMDMEADYSLDAHADDGETSRRSKNFDSNKGIQCEVCGQAVEEQRIEAHMAAHSDEG